MSLTFYAILIVAHIFNREPLEKTKFAELPIGSCRSCFFQGRHLRGCRPFRPFPNSSNHPKDTLGNKKTDPRGPVFMSVGWILPTVFVRDGEFLAGVTTTCAQYAAAIGGSHACAEAVLVHALALGGLECSFHISSFLYFSHKGLQR